MIGPVTEDDRRALAFWSLVRAEDALDAWGGFTDDLVRHVLHLDETQPVTPQRQGTIRGLVAHAIAAGRTGTGPAAWAAHHLETTTQLLTPATLVQSTRTDAWGRNFTSRPIDELHLPAGAGSNARYFLIAEVGPDHVDLVEPNGVRHRVSFDEVAELLATDPELPDLPKRIVLLVSGDPAGRVALAHEVADRTGRRVVHYNSPDGLTVTDADEDGISHVHATAAPGQALRKLWKQIRPHRPHFLPPSSLPRNDGAVTLRATAPAPARHFAWPAEQYVNLNEESAATHSATVSSPRGAYRRTGPYTAELDGTVLTLPPKEPSRTDKGFTGSLLSSLRHVAPTALENLAAGHADTAEAFSAWLSLRVTDADVSGHALPPLDGGAVVPLHLLLGAGVPLSQSQQVQAALSGDELALADVDLGLVHRFRLLLVDPTYADDEQKTAETATELMPRVLSAVVARDLGVRIALVNSNGEVEFFGGDDNDGEADGDRPTGDGQNAGAARREEHELPLAVVIHEGEDHYIAPQPQAPSAQGLEPTSSEGIRWESAFSQDLALLRTEVARELRALDPYHGPVDAKTVEQLHDDLPSHLLRGTLRQRGEAIAQILLTGRLAGLRGGAPQASEGGSPVPGGRGTRPPAAPYTRADELLADLRTSVIAPIHMGRPEEDTFLLGPDLFGTRRPTPPAGFLAGHDFTSLTGGQAITFLRQLNVAEEEPSSTEMAPARLAEDERVWVTERSGPELRDWAGRADLPPLPATAETPALLHSIWLGSPLKGTGKTEMFREGLEWTAINYPDLQLVLWTDIPRADFDRAKALWGSWNSPYLESVAEMMAWLDQRGIVCASVGDAFNAESPMRLHEFYEAESAKQAGPGYAAASDILRLEILRRFGGVYLDGDNLFEHPEFLEEVLKSREGYGIDLDEDSGTIGNSALAMPMNHPFATVYLDEIKKRYGKSQRDLMPPEVHSADISYFATPQGRIRRNSVMERTGPAVLNGVARQIGIDSAAFPSLPGVITNSSLTWLDKPESGPQDAPAPGRPETLRTAQLFIQSLVRDLYNRDGDLHLTAADQALHGHPQRDLLWEAALAFIAELPELASKTVTVTAQRFDGNGWYEVEFPAAAAAWLDFDTPAAAGERPTMWLGEYQTPVRLRPRPRR
ncbi:TcdA/TcdB catalytic glycosyltransferase domain-containing protein [Streptomyces sp. NPDC002403]